MRIYCFLGLPSSRFRPLVEECMGYSGECGLCQSTHLACHIVYPVLAILRIGVVMFLKQS